MFVLCSHLPSCCNYSFLQALHNLPLLIKGKTSVPAWMAILQINWTKIAALPSLINITARSALTFIPRQCLSNCQLKFAIYNCNIKHSTIWNQFWWGWCCWWSWLGWWWCWWGQERDWLASENINSPLFCVYRKKALINIAACGGRGGIQRVGYYSCTTKTPACPPSVQTLQEFLWNPPLSWVAHLKFDLLVSFANLETTLDREGCNLEIVEQI